MKNAFTLIELLAVIVILAIIALIAMPIVLSIINDAKSSATISSAEFYMDAVVQSIMSKNLELKGGTINPSFCSITKDGDIVCENNKEAFEVKMDGKKPDGGTILLSEGSILNAVIKYDDITIVMNAEKQLEYTRSSSENNTLCIPVTEDTKTTGNVPTGNFNIGDEYICDVGRGKSYRFFVLSREAESVNLILDQNINSDGTLVSFAATQATAINGVYSLVEWVSDGETSNGPTTAIAFLDSATADWDYLPELNEIYSDSNLVYSNFNLSGKARLPKKLELNTAGCISTQEATTCPLFLSNYLSLEFANYQNVTKISGVNGYWTFDITENASDIWIMNGLYGTTWGKKASDNDIGIRPVISIPKVNMK